MIRRRLRIELLALFFAACAHGDAATDKNPDKKKKAAEDASAQDEEVDQEEADKYGTDSKKRGEASVSVTFATTAAENWRRAEEDFTNEDYLAAQKFYTYIKSKFPYSAFAVRSELRIADCLFARERYLEAIDAYSNFQRLHPTHKDVAYAAFRIGASYHRQIPSDWFFLPHAYEKDQTAVKDAARALSAYVERYPKDENHEEGAKLLHDIRDRLVHHERMVADFYNHIDKPKSYLRRLETIHDQYADVALDDALLAEMIDGYAVIGDPVKGKKVLEEMEAKFPASRLLTRARSVAAAIVRPALTSTTAQR